MIRIAQTQTFGTVYTQHTFRNVRSCESSITNNMTN